MKKLLNSRDHYYLKQALDLAKTRRGFCSPNPSVGAVIVFNDEVIASGCHFTAGSPHAEVAALSQLPLQQAQDATIYITLEPCCHWGKTPPCTDAIIAAGIKRVVYAYRDPYHKVNGQGHVTLQAKNILCEYIELPEINAFYASYDYWVRNKKPFITAKIALSLDGKIAGKYGECIKITGEVLDQFTHTARKASDAILTTAKTILHDDPQLNARCGEEIIRKKIYILDTHLRTPETAKIFRTAESVTVFYEDGLPRADASRARNDGTGLRYVPISLSENGLNLQEIVDFIGQDGIHDLWIEAGGKCFSAFMTQKLLQRALIYVAPCWLGNDGQAAFTTPFNLNRETCNIHWQQYGKDALCDIHW